MNVIKQVRHAHAIKEDPIGFIGDAIIKALFNLFCPIPLAGTVIAYFRGPIFAVLLSLVVFTLFMIITVGAIIASPLILSSGFLAQIISSSPLGSTNLSPDSSFLQSSIPTRIPLGGIGLEYASITAGFMDPGYFLTFGKNHTGIDLVPSEAYYQQSKSFAATHKVIVYATHTGTGRFYIDEEGGETVEVTNSEDSLKTIYIHFKEVYIKTGDTIAAGEPIGEMGRTGHATGEHIHYEIRIKDGDTWMPVNPLTYIK